MLIFNNTQTALPENLESLGRELSSDLLEHIDQVQFIHNMVSPHRRKAKNMPKDEEGKIIVDFTNPHILENMDFFRQPAIHYQKHGCYTSLPANRIPGSEYDLFWKEEARRCRDGLVRKDGEWISGYFYWYLNYSPIMKNKEISGKKAVRTRDFPDLYDGDYLFFHYVERARNEGSHCAVLKKRGSGNSFKASAMAGRNFVLGEKPFTSQLKSPCITHVLANEKEFLVKDAVLNKFVQNIDWAAENTPWPSIRELKDSPNDMAWKMGYKDSETGTEVGSGNEVLGTSLKNDPQKARGKRGVLVLWEESGKAPNLLQAWNIARESVEEGNYTFGTMITFGCVCKGSRIYLNTGEVKNVEDLSKSDIVLGYDSYQASEEHIEHFNPIGRKQCVEIITNSGRNIKCSIDHPILYSTKDLVKRVPGKRATNEHMKSVKWNEAGNIKVGEQVSIIEEIPFWGTKEMWEPRLVGWLIGDGSYGHDKTPRLSNCEDELNNYIDANFDTVIEKSHITKLGKLYRETRIKGICPKLRELGIYGQTKLAKTLPKDIFLYRKEDICELLGGLFDTDGYVGLRKEGGVLIDICSMSKSLLMEILILLNKLGIHGVIHLIKMNPNNPKDRNDYYRLTISDKRSLCKFSDTIKLIPAVKNYRISLIKERLASFKIRDSKYINGIRFERVIKINNIGEQDIYNFTTSNTHTYIVNGIVTHNTGGVEGADFTALKEMFYNPQGYNICAIRNVFDKNVNEDSICSFFFSAYLNRKGCYDENGNSDVIKALIEILKDRIHVKKYASDPSTLTQRKAEMPITPQEAIMVRTGSLFPVFDIREYLAEIIPNFERFVRPHFVGRLIVGTNGIIEFKEDPTIQPIREYPLKDTDNKEGAVEIFEKPLKNKEGKTFPFRYIGGIDPVDDDVSTTVSVPSIIIFDRYTDRIVAEYTGRYRTSNEFYEVCRRLLLYYGATANYENDKKGLYTYFANHGALHLLCTNLEILEQKGIAHTKANYGNKKYGTNSGKEVNALGRRLQADWMLDIAKGTGGEDESGNELPTKINLQMIRSIGYLKEALMWNPDGNFDRVSAMGMLMLYREDLRRIETGVKQESVNTKTQDPFFNRMYKPSQDSGLVPKIKYSIFQ